jgi:hypothetical protein
MMSALSPSEVVDALDADTRTEKRASWEGFEFTVLEGGEIEVVNGSHDQPEEHTYTVHVEGGIPSDCTCPAFEYQEGACKHMVAVAIREPVFEAVTSKSPMRADGGVTVEAGENDHPHERPEDCDCWDPEQGLPCWPCYRDGFEKPNPDVEGDE